MLSNEVLTTFLFWPKSQEHLFFQSRQMASFYASHCMYCLQVIWNTCLIFSCPTEFFLIHKNSLVNALKILTWANLIFLLALNFNCLNSKHQQFHFSHMNIRPCEESRIVGLLNLRRLKFDASKAKNSDQLT